MKLGYLKLFLCCDVFVVNEPINDKEKEEVHVFFEGSNFDIPKELEDYCVFSIFPEHKDGCDYLRIGVMK